jgi:hypothetical protein
MCIALVRLCETAAGSCSVDCIELAVLCLYDREDALGIASFDDSRVQLDLLCGWPAGAAGHAADGLAVLSPDLARRR